MVVLRGLWYSQYWGNCRSVNLQENWLFVWRHVSLIKKSLKLGSEIVQLPQPVIAMRGDTRQFVLAPWAPLECEKDRRIFGCERANGWGRQCVVLPWLLRRSFSSSSRVHIHLLFVEADSLHDRFYKWQFILPDFLKYYAKIPDQTLRDLTPMLTATHLCQYSVLLAN